ncbi:MAG TPA: methylmalonyl Co-A mutase-associated GTPase MeaB [Polyangiaceae bacterium]|nr:methylmalonyl Co-A mutase-associated GTPase MeaB [Polyangiaceae bacterium]
MDKPVPATELARRVRAGERRALAQAISLAESTRADHRSLAEALLTELLPFTGGAHRVALTGPPGAGKSTLVDALGAQALLAGQRVAVLAIDPASAVSGGSLLGDAVRMQRLSASERVFLRGSSNAGTLGGTAPGTREAVLLCEAAGFELVLVETVGVGQAEQAVREVCDTLIVVTLAGAGDEVQGLKRGLFEVADIALVNKTDGAGEAAALAFAAELSGALGLLRPQSAPHVAAVSAHSGRGIPELLNLLAARVQSLRASGELGLRRDQQLKQAFSSALSRELLRRVAADERARALLPELEARVSSGKLLPTAAARELAAALFGSGP